MNGRDPDQESATVRTNLRIMAYETGEQLPLLPELEAMPQAPKPGTHPHRVLRLLAQGSALDHRDYIALTDSWRLAAYVETLRKKLGWPILASNVAAPCEASPNRTIAVYKLAQRAHAIATEVAR